MKGDGSIWLPSYLCDPRETSKDPRSAMIAVLSGYEACVGERKTQEHAVDLLRDCDPFSVVSEVSRVSVILGASAQPTDASRQQKIAVGLWGSSRARELLERAERFNRARGNPQSPFLFHTRTLLNTAKLGCVVGKSNGSWISTQDLGYVILIMNDVLDDSLENLDIDTLDGRQALERYFFANAQMNSRPQVRDRLGRMISLFLDRSRNEKLGFDFHSKLARETAIDPDEFVSISLGIFSAFLSITDEDAAQGRHRVDTNSLLGVPGRIAPETIQSGLRAYALDIDTLIERCRLEYKEDSLKSFHFLPFEQRPIITRGSVAVCLSVELLGEAITTGLEHRMLNKNVFSSAERQEFLNYRGQAFDAYATEILRRTFDSARVIDSGTLQRRGDGAQTCDAVVVYPEALILFEWKSTAITLRARTGEDTESIEKILARSVDEASAQIRSTMRLVDSSTLTDLGVHPRNSRHVLPIVIVRDLSLHPAAFESVWQRAEPQAMAARDGVRQLQVFDISDLEFIERLVKSGHSLLGILLDKLSLVQTASLSLRNYLHYKKISIVDDRSDFLHGNVERAFEIAKEQLFESPG